MVDAGCWIVWMKVYDGWGWVKTLLALVVLWGKKYNNGLYKCSYS